MKNIIRVDKDKLTQLLSWGNENKDLVMSTNTSVFESGSIDIVGTDNVFYFKNNGNKTEFLFKNNNRFVMSFTYKRGLSVEGVKNLKYNIQLEGRKSYIESTKKEIIYMYNYINAYMQHNSREVRQNKKDNGLSIGNKGKSVNIKGENNVIMIRNVVYKDYNYNDNAEKRVYIRHMESWTTRGHWRTLKSGKRVWIKQYTKGKKNESVERIYSL